MQTPRPPRPHPGNGHALDVLWGPSAVASAILAGEGLALILALAPGVGGDRGVYFGLASLTIQWVVFLTLGTLYLVRRRLSALGPAATAWLVFAMLVASTWLVAWLAWLVFNEAWRVQHEHPARFALHLCAMTAVIAAFGFIAVQNHWRARQLAIRAKQAELEALQARIRPHFLFNTLNTGAALVHQRPEAVEQLLLDLSDLFRAALAGPQQIPLEDELALARRYLEIEALRFRERLRVNWSVPRTIPDVTVPALTIQPLVENAIRHGVERIPGGGEVDIAVTTAPDKVIVRISNPLPPGDVPGRPGHNVGLPAAQERVEALTAGRGSVSTQREGDRYVATVRLPVNGA